MPSIKNCQFIESEPMIENNPEDQEKREFLLQLGKVVNVELFHLLDSNIYYYDGRRQTIASTWTSSIRCRFFKLSLFA